MVKIITSHSIEDILANPEQYADSSKDLVLCVINDVLIMLGQDEHTNEFYITVEDDETSWDVYPNENQTIKDVYDHIIEEETK